MFSPITNEYLHAIIILSVRRIFMRKYFVLIVLVIFVASFALALSGCTPEEIAHEPDFTLNYTEPESGIPYFTKTNSDGTVVDTDFRILNFTDLHLHDGTSSLTYLTLSIMERHIQREKPDLVVITGDICLGSLAEEAQIALNDVFERNSQYYAIVLGNHDGEGSSISREELITNYENFPFCLTRRGPSDIYGYGNYVINIKGSTGQIVNSLVFMDSGDYTTETKCQEYGFSYKSGYDFIKPDQIDWYKTTLDSIKESNGNIMPKSALFIHIPLYEYADAFDLSQDNENPGQATLVYGQHMEKECSSKINSGMFAAILEKDSTKLVICGHDHVNDYCVEYQGVKLTYSQSLSYGSYFLRANGNLKSLLVLQEGSNLTFPDGATLLTLGADITPSRLLNQDYPQVFEGLEEEIISANINPASLPE